MTGFWTKFFSFCCALSLLVGHFALADKKVRVKNWWDCDQAISELRAFLPAITRGDIERIMISTSQTAMEFIRLEIPQGVGIVSPKSKIVPSMTVKLRSGEPLRVTLVEYRSKIERPISSNTARFYEDMFRQIPTAPENLNFLDGMPELPNNRVARVTRKGKPVPVPSLDLRNVASVTYETAMDVNYTYFINP